jgi:epsilon-lactone hydrolase
MTDDGVPARGSLRSRGAALVIALTLRQISAVLPPEQAWACGWPDQVHVFQALPRLSPEAAKAMAHVARFIDTSRRANGFDAIAGKAG